MSVDLAPCPLCGGSNTYIAPDEVGSGGQWVAPIHVGCKDCGLDMAQHDYTDDAVAAWNRRPRTLAATSSAGDLLEAERHRHVAGYPGPRRDVAELFDLAAQALRHQSTRVTEGWKDISKAPRDGTHFLAYEPTGDMYRAAYGRNGELHAYGGQPVVEPPGPTHWMSLPTPPAAEEV